MIEPENRYGAGPPQGNPVSGRPGGILRQIARDVVRLATTEFALARAEMEDKVDKAETSVVSLILGGVLVVFSAQALTATMILVLATFMAPWLAALVTFLIFSAIAAAFFSTGIKKFKTERWTPDLTLRSVRQDGEAVKEVLNERRKHG